jgi:hypothetical protein
MVIFQCNLEISDVVSHGIFWQNPNSIIPEATPKKILNIKTVSSLIP